MMQTKTLLKHLINWGANKTEIQAPNIYFYDWESDLLHLDPNGYTIEIEIKTSKADYGADVVKKWQKHQHLANGEGATPNFFYFAVPESLPVEDLPSYAGLIRVAGNGRVWKVKEAPMLHRTIAPTSIWKSIAKSIYARKFTFI